MILAIHGRSATGKTTLAAEVAERLGLPLRHCGAALRAASSAARTTVADAPDQLHREVDRATRDWCDRVRAGVAEGRFLDLVLAHRTDVLAVRLRAAPAIRAERLSGREGAAVDEQAVSERDAADDRFAVGMYGSLPIAPASAVVDTDGESAEECVGRILELMRRPGASAPG